MSYRDRCRIRDLQVLTAQDRVRKLELEAQLRELEVQVLIADLEEGRRERIALVAERVALRVSCRAPMPRAEPCAVPNSGVARACAIASAPATAPGVPGSRFRVKRYAKCGPIAGAPVAREPEVPVETYDIASDYGDIADDVFFPTMYEMLPADVPPADVEWRDGFDFDDTGSEPTQDYFPDDFASVLPTAQFCPVLDLASVVPSAPELFAPRGIIPRASTTLPPPGPSDAPRAGRAALARTPATEGPGVAPGSHAESETAAFCWADADVDEAVVDFRRAYVDDRTLGARKSKTKVRNTKSDNPSRAQSKRRYSKLDGIHVGPSPQDAPLRGSGKVLTGVVNFSRSEKGYGFISQHNGGPDIFVHSKVTPFGKLVAGDAVQYSVTSDSDGKPRAMNVSGGSPPRPNPAARKSPPLLNIGAKATKHGIVRQWPHIDVVLSTEALQGPLCRPARRQGSIHLGPALSSCVRCSTLLSVAPPN